MITGYQSRAALVATRWRYLAAVAIASFGMALIVLRAKVGILPELLVLPYWLGYATVALLMALVLAIAPRRLTASLGLRHFPVYPPYWNGVVFGIASALLTIAASDSLASEYGVREFQQHDLLIIGVGAMALSVLPAFVSLVTRTHHGRRASQEQDEAAWKARKPSRDALVTWLSDDRAVATPEQDYFGSRTIATRMASRLLVTAKPAAQAIIGKLGAGKSTVRLLVESYVRAHPCQPPVEVIAIELWPYATPQAAVEGALRAIVDFLSREINTSQLDGIPAAYGVAVAKAGGVSDWIPNSLRRERPPALLLRSLDDAATIINRRYVLWVEDLERFAAGDPASEASNDELERLAPIRALLHGLDTARSFSVVTATTDLFRRFDLEKVSRYVERISDISLHDAKGLISWMRSEWKKVDFIDAVSPSTRTALGWPSDNEGHGTSKLNLVIEGASDFAEAVAALATTPRTLKQGLRRAGEIWERLAGEIDLDDVIALSILTEAQPRALAVIDRNIALLQGRLMRIGQRSDVDPIPEFEKLLSSSSVDGNTQTVVLEITKAIFGRQATRRPQSVRWSSHADYWQRLNALPQIPVGESDQHILRTLVADDDRAVVDLLCSEVTARGVEDFAMVIEHRRLSTLLVTLVQRLLDGNSLSWVDGHGPGMVPLWRMLRGRMNELDLDYLSAQVELAVDMSARRSLSILHELVYWFATEESQITDLLPPGARARIHQRALDALSGIYTNNAEMLAASLEGSEAFVLWWLCWRIERVRHGDAYVGIPFDAWPSFYPTLLRALEAAPSVLAPQLAPFVVRPKALFGRSDEYVFEVDHCNVLFGDAADFRDRMIRATGGVSDDPSVLAVIRGNVTVEGATGTRFAGDDDAADDYNQQRQRHIDAGNQLDVVVRGKTTVNHTPPADGGALGDTIRQTGSSGSFLSGFLETARLPSEAATVSDPRVLGFWFAARERVPDELPAGRPTGCLWPERGDLTDNSLCLDLAQMDTGEWRALSVTGLGEYDHGRILAQGGPAYFVPGDRHLRVYEVSLGAPIERADVAVRFGKQAAALARDDRLTVIVSARRVS